MTTDEIFSVILSCISAEDTRKVLASSDRSLSMIHHVWKILIYPYHDRVLQFESQLRFIVERDAEDPARAYFPALQTNATAEQRGEAIIAVLAPTWTLRTLKTYDSCPNCGGTMLGNGYSSVRHCERVDDTIEIEPDAGPIYCPKSGEGGSS
jgi:hypothetical protein